MQGMVNRTRVEGSVIVSMILLHDTPEYDQQAGCNIIVDVLLYNHSAH